MRKIILLLSFFFITQLSKAQNPTWLWAISDNGNGYEYGQGVVVDSTGDSIFVGGRSSSTSTYGGKTVSNSYNMYPFMAKFDSGGHAAWYTSDPIPSFDYSWSICRDKFYNTYTTGTVNSGGNTFVDKFADDGTLQWSVQPGGGGATGIAADNSGNVYVFISGFYGNLTFGGITITNAGSGTGAAIIKLNSSGTVLWGKPIYGSGNIRAGDIITDNLGHLYIMGGYTNTYTFDTITAPASSGIGNLFVAEYDTAGNSLLLSTATNADYWDGAYSATHGIAIDPCGNVYVTGYIDNTAKFGTFSVSSTGGEDMFVAKMLYNGQWQWVSTAGEAGDDHGYGLGLDKNYDVYVAGDYGENSGTGIKFSSSTSFTGTGTFAARYDNGTGNLVWAQVGGLSNSDHVYGMAVDKFGYTYLTGDYSNSTTYGTFNITGGSGSPSNIFLAKLDTVATCKINSVVLTGSYCPGSTITIPYTANGNFISGNTFTAQLSDSTGSFVNTVAVGSVSSTTNGTITITIPSNTPTGSGYLIRIISSDPAISSFAGCAAFAIGGNLNVSVSPSDTTICSGSSVTLNAFGGDSYMWSNSDTGSTILVTPTLDTTTYVVQVTNGTCTGSDSIKVITNPGGAVALVPLSPTICAGQSIVLKASGYTDYTWSPDSSLSTTIGDTTVAAPQNTIIYTVSGSNPSGCSGTAYDTITVVPAPNIPTITQSGDTLFSSASTDNQWYLNGTLISGATNQYLVIGNSSESYTVSVENPADGCSSTSNALVTSGINQLSIINNQLSIYPNPTNGNLSVTINSSAANVKDWNLHVTDVLGRIIYTCKSLNYSNELDMSDLAAGVYFITITNKAGDGVFKIVKQ